MIFCEHWHVDTGDASETAKNMSVSSYRLSLLEYDRCPVKMTPDQLIALLKSWRREHSFRRTCSKCDSPIAFEGTVPYACCCKQFYYDSRLTCYPVASIAVRTPQFPFLLNQIERLVRLHGIRTDQEFLVIPDPIYWQVSSTLVYEKVMKFVLGLPVTNRTDVVQPPSKVHLFYKQIQEAPLNYGSLTRRSCGKATLIRQVSFGKRCTLSMRGMIVPDASLSPNEIRLPDDVVRRFDLEGQWIILNRMPSLQPGNFVALRVPPSSSSSSSGAATTTTTGEKNRPLEKKPPTSWPYSCFGIPLEIVEAMNADFDGDECNLYVVPNLQSQAECATLLNPRVEMGCFVMGLKLSPSQDMLVAYRLFRDDIDFLPYKAPDLRNTFQVIYDLFGSSATYDCFDRMRRFYLDALQNRTLFGLTLGEMQMLAERGENAPSSDQFERAVRGSGGCLVTQVESKAKGSFDHLYQMFGKMGHQNDHFVESSLWKGLDPVEAVHHATETVNALSRSGKIWEPGYGYSKMVFNLQGLWVNYRGEWVDGNNCVVEKDALNAMHYTRVMSTSAFEHLLDTVLVSRRRGESPSLSTRGKGKKCKKHSLLAQRGRGQAAGILSSSIRIPSGGVKINLKKKHKKNKIL